MFSDITLKKGLNGSVFDENNNYLMLEVKDSGSSGNANVLYIDKITKDTRVLVNQEYTLNSSTGGNEAKYPVFSLGSLNP